MRRKIKQSFLRNSLLPLNYCHRAIFAPMCLSTRRRIYLSSLLCWLLLRDKYKEAYSASSSSLSTDWCTAYCRPDRNSQHRNTHGLDEVRLLRFVEWWRHGWPRMRRIDRTTTIEENPRKEDDLAPIDGQSQRRKQPHQRQRHNLLSFKFCDCRKNNSITPDFRQISLVNPH